jgi:CheY-like chemotaxis protein/GGDEF domain-containing protein
MSRARILAVDDQRYFRELIEGMLVDAGYTVETCGSGEEALQRLEHEDFDVILTDLVMPEIDGAELVRRVRERRPEQDIVMVTGVVDVKTAVETMKLGATDYILKPFDRGLLVDALEKILTQRRLREEHARLIEENLAFMGVLSLVERASGLFATLAVEPLAERLLEGLCLETGARSGVLWLAEEPDRDGFLLVGVHGSVRIDAEPERVTLADLEEDGCPGLSEARSVEAAPQGDEQGARTLYVPIRAEGRMLGLARLSDPIEGDAFEDRNRAMVEKFAGFGGLAVQNALRFRALERRSLRDPVTRAYSLTFFEDAVRNEIQKSTRFGHRFSILRVEAAALRGAAAEASPAPEAFAEAALRIEGVLRATDLMAWDEEGAFLLLMPQTDSLGAGVLGQRIRSALSGLQGRDAEPGIRTAAATFPVDGTRVEQLEVVLKDRVAQAAESLIARRPDLVDRSDFEQRFDQLLGLGRVESPDTEGQILRFVLEDVARRPDERGLLFLSPGTRWLPDVLDLLEKVHLPPGGTEVVLVAGDDVRASVPHVTRVGRSALDTRRPFLVSFGDGPAYAMIGAPSGTAGRAPLFQTADRALVEHLAFELQRELGINLVVYGGAPRCRPTSS